MGEYNKQRMKMIKSASARQPKEYSITSEIIKNQETNRHPNPQKRIKTNQPSPPEGQKSHRALGFQQMRRTTQTRKRNV
jgi:hypothetical protein